jgi:hypothetical protein
VLLLEIGQWYEPDENAVPSRCDDERARDERYVARLKAKGILDHDPWLIRRHAMAVAILLERILEQFGVGATIELRTRFPDDVSVIAGRIRRVGVEHGVLQVFFARPRAVDRRSATHADDHVTRNWTNVNCEIVTGARVVSGP